MQISPEKDTIAKLSIRGLFGRFNYDLDFSGSGSIAILIAPNGHGKTAILRIIDSIFSGKYSFLWNTAFKNITVILESGRRIKVNKEIHTKENGDLVWTKIPLLIRTTGFEGGPSDYRFDPYTAITDVRIIERQFPVISVGPDQWRHIRTNRTLTAHDLIELYWSKIQDIIFPPSTLPTSLQDSINSVNIHLVETQRLSLPEYDSLSWLPFNREEAPHTSAVENNAEHLADHVSNLFQQYAEASQDLDQALVERILDSKMTSKMSRDEIQQNMNELAMRRDRLVSVGILRGTLVRPIPKIENIDGEIIPKVLEIYLDNAKKKLDIFENSYKKIELFKEIINENFSYKSIKIDSNHGITAVDNDSGNQIPLSELSSGEQHELILIYNLLFRIGEGSTILIDEPEISLHVAWQKRFIHDLKKIERLTRMKAIIATHSPQIISDHLEIIHDLVQAK